MVGVTEQRAETENCCGGGCPPGNCTPVSVPAPNPAPAVAACGGPCTGCLYTAADTSNKQGTPR